MKDVGIASILLGKQNGTRLGVMFYELQENKVKAYSPYIKGSHKCRTLLPRILRRVNPQAINFPVCLSEFTWVVVDN
jgi:hypothetical protein